MTKKKIKDLASYDVYSYNGQKFIYLNAHEVISMFGAFSIELKRPSVLEEEVEVIGRMEFICDGQKEDIDLEIARIMRTGP